MPMDLLPGICVLVGFDIFPWKKNQTNKKKSKLRCALYLRDCEAQIPGKIAFFIFLLTLAKDTYESFGS